MIIYICTTKNKNKSNIIKQDKTHKTSNIVEMLLMNHYITVKKKKLVIITCLSR